MTPTQIARRSDALYADGTCGMTRRVLCDMVAQREADLENARAEKAKLRGQYETVLADYRSEVAKLRELAHDLLQPILADGFDCYGCVYEDDCEGMHYTDRCKLLDRARELGVEVDDGY